MIEGFATAVVEDVNDPLSMGRVKARCLEYHTTDMLALPTEDLPWATCLLPVDSAGVASVGSTNVQLIKGSWVTGFFRDPGDYQDFVIIGAYPKANNEGGIGVSGGPSAATGGFVGANSGWDGFPAPATVAGSPAEKIISLCKSQLQVRETNGSNQGPGLQKYWDSVGWDGYASRSPWCAAFVTWIIEQTGVLEDKDRPKTASAFAYRQWANKHPHLAQRRVNPQTVYAGDIVVFKFSHIGMAIENSNGGYVQCIEGNTNAAGSREGHGVYIKKRALSLITDSISIAASPERGGMAPSGTIATGQPGTPTA